VALLDAMELPTGFATPAPREVLEALGRDKKARDGRVPFVLLKALGRAEVSFDVRSAVALEVLEEVHRGTTPRHGR
jgi:3-dehydroquinate synthetase